MDSGQQRGDRNSERQQRTELTTLFVFIYVHIPSSKIVMKDNDAETRTNVTTAEQGLHPDTALMVRGILTWVSSLYRVKALSLVATSNLSSGRNTPGLL